VATASVASTPGTDGACDGDHQNMEVCVYIYVCIYIYNVNIYICICIYIHIIYMYIYILYINNHEHMCIYVILTMHPPVTFVEQHSDFEKRRCYS